VEAEEVVDAKKVSLGAEQAWALLQVARAVTVAKGSKFVRFDQVAKQKDELLKQALGPTGNLRAPTFRVGDEFVIGFSPELYENWLK
jgi:hypothetical protein